jgi:hypothetical protein
MIYRCRRTDPADTSPVCEKCRRCIDRLFAMPRFGISVTWTCSDCSREFAFKADANDSREVKGTVPLGDVADMAIAAVDAECRRLCEGISRMAWRGCALANSLPLAALAVLLALWLCGVELGWPLWATGTWCLAWCVVDQIERTRAHWREYGRWPWS